MESIRKIKQQGLRYEGDLESQNYIQKISPFCHELKESTTIIEESFFSQHALLLPKQREPIFSYGLLQ